MAAIIYDQNTYLCGGAIISPRYVISAASCFRYTMIIQPNEYGKLSMTYGNVKWKEGYKNGVQQIKYMNDYHPSQYWMNNLALLFTTWTIEYTWAMHSIDLGVYAMYGTENLVLSSWGKTRYDQPEVSDDLLYVDLKAMNKRQCRHYVVPEPVVADQLPMVMCAASPTVNRTLCSDFGSPVVYNNVLVGISNFNMEYCNEPNVFTRISYFHEWIVQNMVVPHSAAGHVKSNSFVIWAVFSGLLFGGLRKFNL